MTAAMNHIRDTANTTAGPRLESRKPAPTDYGNVGPFFACIADANVDELTRKRLRHCIITSCMPLAEHIAHRFGGRGESFDDLVQVAALGLIKAVDRYDITRGSEFVSFAAPTMIGEVRRHFRDKTWAVHVPRGVKDTHLRLRSTTEELSHRLGRSPTVHEIADELGVDSEDMTQALLAGNAYKPSSTDTTPQRQNPGEQTQSDSVAIDEPGYAHVEAQLTVQPLLAGLPARERDILAMRFFGSMTQSQIARNLGISQMHVSRLLAKTLSQLREQSIANG